MKSQNGRVWWTVGAQEGVCQPPYAIRLRGRWYRTLPLTAPAGESYLSDEMRAWLEGLPQLENGVRRVLDYLNRTNKHFRDLPLLVEPPAQTILHNKNTMEGESR